MRNTSLTERYTDLSNKSTFYRQAFFPTVFLSIRILFPPYSAYIQRIAVPLMRLPLQNVHRALRPWIGTSLFKRCIQPAIYLKINSLLIHTLLFVKQFFFFCRTNPVGRFAQNVIFRIHPVWIAVFFVILRRAKHLLKRDLPLCPTKIPLNGKGSRGISQLTKCVWGYPIILICQ